MMKKIFYQTAVVTFMFVQLIQSPLLAQSSETEADAAIAYNKFVSDQWLAVNTTMGKFMANLKVDKAGDLENLRAAIVTQIETSRIVLNEKTVFENNLNLQAGMIQLIANFKQIAENEMVEISALLSKGHLREADEMRLEELVNQINMNKSFYEQAFVGVQAGYAKKYNLLFIGGSMVKDNSK